MTDEQEVIKIIEAMGKFMKQTNEMLAKLKLQIENQQVDIDKLKKKENRIASLLS